MTKTVDSATRPPRRATTSLTMTVIIAVITALVLSSCSSHAGQDRDHASGPAPDVARRTETIERETLSWTRCPSLPGAPDPSTPGLRCAGLSVPRDYAHPAAGSLTVTVSRRTDPASADRPTSTRPVVISNPGGPGASGLFNTLGVDGAFGGRLAATFDLISFDPRGINRSSPVDCGLSTSDAARASGGRAPSTFDDDAAFARRVADSCRTHGRADDPFATTINTIRDVELLRRALGQDRISWVGTSYGTELAIGYASMFPDHTERVIVDSPSDVTRPWWSVTADSAAAADTRFDQIADLIAARDHDWHLGADRAAVRRSYLAVLHRLDTQTVRLDDERVTAADLQSARLTPALLDDGAIEPLAQSLRFLLAVPGAPSAAELITLLDKADRAGSGPSEVNGQSLAQQIAAYYTVRCNDAGWPSEVAYYRNVQQAEIRRFPITRGQFSMINACAFWRPVPREPMPTVTDRGWSGGPNILMLSATGDYRAYPAGVQNTRRALGRRAVSITTGDYHHVVAGRNACATDAAASWLLDDHPTGQDRRCPA